MVEVDLDELADGFENLMEEKVLHFWWNWHEIILLIHELAHAQAM